MNDSTRQGQGYGLKPETVEPSFPDYPMTPTKDAMFDDSGMEIEGRLEITTITGQSLWIMVLAVTLICASILAAGFVVAKQVARNTNALLCWQAVNYQKDVAGTYEIKCEDGKSVVINAKQMVLVPPVEEPVVSMDGEFY